MAVRRIRGAVKAVRVLADAGTVAGFTDRQLLERFLSAGGAKAEAAFAALVVRHGPMVRRVCRELLPDARDVEDAAQATFWVLARRANTLRDPERLGPWLYGVALRAARRARASDRRGRHRPLPDRDAPPADASHSPESRTALREEAAALHEELARLPRKYREAVVLCHLEGNTHQEAARRLGCPPSTVSTRLVRARELLRTRLARRGVAPAAGLLATAEAAGGATAEAAGLAPWAEATVRGAVRLAAGRTPSATVSTRTSQLTEGVLKSMTITHGKAATAACLAAGVLALCGGVLAQQAPRGQRPDVPHAHRAPGAGRAAVSPGRRYSELVKAYRNAERSLDDSMAKLTDPSERAAFHAAHWPLANAFTRPFLELARDHPGDPAAFDALAWVVVFGFSAPESDAAARLLARGWPSDPRLWALCQEMSRFPISAARGALLRAVVDHGPDRATRSRACLALAGFLKEEAEFVRLLQTPGVTPWHAQFLTKDRLDQFRPLDAGRLAREAEGLYERVVREFADVHPVDLSPAPRSHRLDGDARQVFTYPQDVERPGGTLGERARSALEELRSPGAGDPAPEIDGEDADGRRFKLSNYRGKVAVVVFSGNWCGPCRAMYPQERALAERFKGRPFALLSVNTDEDKDVLKASIASGEITWRCWWEGARGASAVVDRWGVRSWPTVCVLDARGVIRHRLIGLHPESFDPKSPPLSALIEGLLKEMKAVPAPSPGPPGNRKG